MLTGLGFLTVFGIMFCIGGWYGVLVMAGIIGGYYLFWIWLCGLIDYHNGIEWADSKEYKEMCKRFGKEQRQLQEDYLNGKYKNSKEYITLSGLMKELDERQTKEQEDFVRRKMGNARYERHYGKYGDKRL